jgi:hypothetical protein
MGSSLGHRQSGRSILVLGLALSALAFGAGSAAAAPPPSPPPAQLDTATATGDNLALDDFSSSNINVDAHSGPSGENPGGSVSFDVGVERLPLSGPVTCLNVTGNTAVMTVSGPFPSFPSFPEFIVKLVDNGGSGNDIFQYFPTLPGMPVDCKIGSPAYFGGPLIGRAVVFDAPAGPTSKDECRDGGFAQLGFRNQGQCIRSVTHGP